MNRGKPIQRYPMKRRGMKNGAEFRKLCREIWDERPHRCERCGVHLGDEACVWMFHHLTKRSQGGKHTRENIGLRCLPCHDQEG